jgi:arylsulfatase A-like enzyme
MERDEITIAEVLKSAGYVTAHIGKWHLGAEAWYPERQGYDVNLGGCDYGQPPSYFDPYEAKHGGIPTLAPRKPGEYLTDREADEAVRFLREHRNRPFFLHLAHYAVHTPVQARPDLVARYEAKKTEQGTPGRLPHPVYAAMVESVDHAVGRILDTLDDLGISERTMVLFFSDNGGLTAYTSNAPLRAGKGTPYEGGIRVPLLVRWPALVPPGSTCATPVSSIDFFPTLAEAAEAALPEKHTLDGVSLMPLLRGGGAIARDAIFWHFPHYRGKGVVPYSIVRSGDWKLIRRYEGRSHELFDLRQDPSESTDLSDRMPERVKELDRRLDGWLRDVNARIPKKAKNEKPGKPNKQ